MKSFGNIDHSLIAGAFPFQGKFFPVHLKFTVYADIQITHDLFFADFFPEKTCIKPDGLARISLSDFLRKGCSFLAGKVRTKEEKQVLPTLTPLPLPRSAIGRTGGRCCFVTLVR